MAETRENAELRLLEVLLEEELGGAARSVALRPRRSRWIAAAIVLLGTGAVGGTWWLRATGNAAAGAPLVMPQDHGDSRGAVIRFLEGVRWLRLVLLPSTGGDANSALEIREPIEVGRWCDALAASLRGGVPEPIDEASWAIELHADGADNQVLLGRMSSAGQVQFGDSACGASTIALLRLALAAQQAWWNRYRATPVPTKDGAPSRDVDEMTDTSRSGLPQEPQGGAKEPQAVRAKDLDHLRELIGGVQKVVIRALPRPSDVPFLPDVPILGRLFTNDRDLGTNSGVDGLEPLTIDARDQVQAWVQAVRACESPKEALTMRRPDLEVQLHIGEGMMLAATADGLTHHTTESVIIGQLQLAPSPELRQLLDAAGEALQRAGRRRLGIALDLDELRALPTAATAVQCPCFGAADFRAELPRFSALERLALVEQGLSQLPTGETIAAIAAVATLRALELPADALTDADVATLAQLPLRELRLTGRLRNVTAAPFTRFRQLEALTLDVAHCEVDLRAVLAALPVLRELAFGTYDWVDDLALDALASTKVVQLRIGGSPGKPMGSARLQGLAGIPSLRELHLHDIGIGPDELQAFARMKSLRKLALSRCVWSQPEGHDEVNQAALQTLLPDCEVVEVPLSNGLLIELPVIQVRKG